MQIKYMMTQNKTVTQVLNEYFKPEFLSFQVQNTVNGYNAQLDFILSTCRETINRRILYLQQMATFIFCSTTQSGSYKHLSKEK